MEKIDINKIRGSYIEITTCESCKNNGKLGCSNDYVSGGDDTIKSIKMVAEKVNELLEMISVINKENNHA